MVALTQQAQSAAPNLDRLKQQLGDVGLKDRDECKGTLLRARTRGGDTVFVLIGPKDFKGDKAVDWSAEDLSKFQQHGFESVDVVQNIKVVQGTLDKAHVIALTGRGIASGSGAGATTGASC